MLSCTMFIAAAGAHAMTRIIGQMTAPSPCAESRPGLGPAASGSAKPRAASSASVRVLLPPRCASREIVGQSEMTMPAMMRQTAPTMTSRLNTSEAFCLIGAVNWSMRSHEPSRT